MIKLSITFAATVLCISFAPAASAYGTEPAPLDQGKITQITAPLVQTAGDEEACVLPISPQLASVLALPRDWRAGDDAKAETALACAAD